jgi:hypothetical protein
VFYSKFLAHYFRKKYIGKQIKESINNIKIPVLICSFDRLYYLKKIINQFNKLSIKPIVLDNNSSNEDLLKFYKNKNKKFFLIKLFKNFGHNVIYEKFIYKNLPKIFAYTDCDISLNKKLKKNFLFYLKNLTERYKIQKAGFAIDIRSTKKFKLQIYVRNKNNKIVSRYINLKDYEKRFWEKKVQKKPAAYEAKIDTTFAVYNKKYMTKNKLNAIRVADNFTCKHLPWEKKNKEPLKELKYYKKSKKNISSTVY